MQLFGAKLRDLAEALTYHRIARVDLDHFAGFCVLDGNYAQIGEHALAGIFNWQRHEIVTSIRLAQRETKISDRVRVVNLGLEIREKKDDRAPLDSVVDEVEGMHQIGAAVYRLEGEHFPHDPENMSPTFPRRNEQFDLIREEKKPDLIAVFHC